MTIQSLRVLVRLDFPGRTFRLWDGSGPMMDEAGEVWIGVKLSEGLDTIEHAINGEAVSFTMALSGVDPDTANLAWADYEAGSVIGAAVRILIQPCDEWDQPAGLPEVKFTGNINNLVFDDTASDEGIQSGVSVEVVNRFSLRSITNGQVLSDADQKARSVILNPAASPDRSCERISLLADKTIRWPVYD